MYTGSAEYWTVIVYGGQRAGVYAGYRRGTRNTLTERGGETSTGVKFINFFRNFVIL
jgi:hypothetical protein